MTNFDKLNFVKFNFDQLNFDEINLNKLNFDEINLDKLKATLRYCATFSPQSNCSVVHVTVQHGEHSHRRGGVHSRTVGICFRYSRTYGNGGEYGQSGILC